MHSTKYIGLDVHQATISVAVLDSKGKLVMESIIETKAVTILELIQGLRGNLQVTFEEGTSAAWLYDLLVPHIAKVLVCNPRKNALLKSGNKNDRTDARKLAELLRGGQLSPVYHAENGVRTLKELARSYLTITKDLTRQLPVNARRSPSRIFSGHAKDQSPNMLAHRLPAAHSSGTRDPSPVKPKAGAMPSYNRLGCNQDERLFPAGPEPSQDDPEGFVPCSDSEARSLVYRASNCRRSARFSRSSSSRERKMQTIQPMKYRSTGIIGENRIAKPIALFTASRSFYAGARF
jgi:transposase